MSNSAIIQELKAAQVSEVQRQAKIARDVWYSDAKAYAEYFWCYADLITDADLAFEAERQAGTMPSDAVERIGEDSDLNTLDPMTMAARKKPNMLFKPEWHIYTPLTNAAWSD